MGCCESSTDNFDKSTQVKTIKQPVSKMKEKVGEKNWRKV